jgi:hypothetical protein
MNLMAEGPVETPIGTLTPPARTFPRAEKPTDPATQMPSAGPVFALPAGVNRFGFTGQTWKGHPTAGIDWDMFLLPEESQLAHIGNWANQSSPSMGEFERSQGRNYEERQHILRVRGTGSFTTVIVPWNKGAKPADINVSREGDSVVVKTPTLTIRFRPDGTWTL